MISLFILICNLETCAAITPELFFNALDNCDNYGYEFTVRFLERADDTDLKIEYECHNWRVKQNESL